MDASEIAALKVSELKEKLAELDLPTTGLKAELVTRLTEALSKHGTKRAHDDDEDDGEDAQAVKKQKNDDTTDGDSANAGEAAEPSQAQDDVNGTSEAEGKKDGVNGTGDAESKETPPRELGKVKWFDVKKGYGFLIRQNAEKGKEDVFCHQSSIVNTPGTKGIAEDETVEFFVTVEPSGRLRANEVTAPGGKAPPKGQPDPALPVVPVAFAAPAAPVQKPLPPHTKEELPAGRFRGSVKWFDVTKGFGFITPEDKSDDVFVHQTSLKVDGSGNRSVAEKENVEFELTTETDAQGKTKRKANNVTGPGGAAVVGVPKPLPVVQPLLRPVAPMYAHPAYAAHVAQVHAAQVQQAAHAHPAYAQYPGYGVQQHISPAKAAASPYGAPASPYAQQQRPAAPAASPYGYPYQQQQLQQQAAPAPAAAQQQYDYSQMSPEQYAQYQQQWSQYYAAQAAHK